MRRGLLLPQLNKSAETSDSFADALRVRLICNAPVCLRTDRGFFYFYGKHRCIHRCAAPYNAVGQQCQAKPWGGFKYALATPNQNPQNGIQKITVGLPLPYFSNIHRGVSTPPKFSNIGFPYAPPTLFKYWSLPLEPPRAAFPRPRAPVPPVAPCSPVQPPHATPKRLQPHRNPYHTPPISQNAYGFKYGLKYGRMGTRVLTSPPHTVYLGYERAIPV